MDDIIDDFQDKIKLVSINFKIIVFIKFILNNYLHG